MTNNIVVILMISMYKIDLRGGGSQKSFSRNIQRFSLIPKLQKNNQTTKETCKILVLKFMRIKIINSNLNIWLNIRFVDEREEKDWIVLIGFYRPEKFLRRFPFRKNMLKTK